MLDGKGLRFRAAVLRSIRSFFYGRGFLEVDTPVRQPVLLPESTIVPVQSGAMFLQPSPEQCMKRLLARGSGPLFQICRCFRAEERGRRHLEEFTMLEWYRVDGDYHDLMADCEKLLRHLLRELKKDAQHREIVRNSCFEAMPVFEPWQRISVKEAFAAWSLLPLGQALAEDRFDEMIVTCIEPRLGRDRPVFLYDYPASCASLARLKNGDHTVAERFELYIDGMELANGFTELTDAVEQRARFIEEQSRIYEHKIPTTELPERFLEDLTALDSAAGIAFGLDRLMMLLRSARSIEEVVTFAPTDWH